MVVRGAGSSKDDWHLGKGTGNNLGPTILLFSVWDSIPAKHCCWEYQYCCLLVVLDLCVCGVWYICGNSICSG
jgi:hypothetical protein